MILTLFNLLKIDTDAGRRHLDQYYFDRARKFTVENVEGVGFPTPNLSTTHFAYCLASYS